MKNIRTDTSPSAPDGLERDACALYMSVGKGFAYGAQDGILLVQGNADSRACVRLSGVQVVLGGEIAALINDLQRNLQPDALYPPNPGGNGHTALLER